MPEHLFTYGTLSPGHNNHAAQLLQQHATPIGTGTLRAQLYDLGEYPGAIDSTNEHDRIIGTIHQLNNPSQTLPELDAYEECSPNPDQSLFLRVRRDVQLDTGETMPNVWVYLYNQSVTGRTRIS